MIDVNEGRDWEIIEDTRPFFIVEYRNHYIRTRSPYNDPAEPLKLPIVLNHRPVLYGVNTPDLHRSLVL